MNKYYVGIDLGSRTSKIALLNQNQKIVDFEILSSGINPNNTAKALFNTVQKRNNILEKQIITIFSTGYGRKTIKSAEKRVSEISCHAKGTTFFFPKAKTIIDIGGQDSKVILVNDKGKVIDFAMNDKCAAGTGRFLEVAANILGTSVDKLAEIAKQSKNDIKISSICVVFAESEIIGLINKDAKQADIIKAVHKSVAKKTKNLLSRLSWQPPIVFTGGVANNSSMRKELESILNNKIQSPKIPSFTGAVGAALKAFEKYEN